jgi:hypothetical protein
VFVLAHGVRFKFNHIENILRTANNIQYYSRIHIYFDEFDNYSNIIVNSIDRFCSFSKVELYELISATVVDSRIIRDYGDIPSNYIIDLWGEGSYNPEEYITYDEQIKNNKFFTFEKHGKELLFTSLIHFFGLKSSNKKSFYGFIPAQNKKETHWDLIGTIHELDSDISICLLNSDFKGIILPNKATYEFDINQRELLDLIIEAKHRFNIKKLIVTGNGCVGRSMTLQGKHTQLDYILTFDFAIYDEDVAKNGDNAYQMDRTKGNIKSLVKHYPVTYCTPKFKKWVMSREKISMIASMDNRISVKEHTRNINETMIIPDNTKVINFEDELGLDKPENCITFLKMKGFNPLKTVKSLEYDPISGKYMCCFSGRLSVLYYDENISKFRNFSPKAKYEKHHIEKLKEGKKNDCIFNRWVLYKNETPYYYLKVLYKTL